MQVDNLSYGSREYIFNAYPLMLNLFNKIYSNSLLKSSILLTQITGILSVSLFYLILRKFNLSSFISFLSSFILILTPVFIYLFNTLNNYSFVIFLGLIALYLMLVKSKFAFIPLVLIPFFGLSNILIVSILLIFYSLNKKEFSWLFVLVIYLILVIVYFGIYGIQDLIGFSVLENSLTSNFISDFNALHGFSMFTIILFIFGFLYLWEEKYKSICLYSSILFLLLISFSNINFISYLVFFVSVLAALGIVKIFRIKWNSKLIRNLTFSLILIGVVFSFTTYFNGFYNQEPTKDLFDSLTFLNKETNNGDVIFSHYSIGHLITSITKRKNMMDSNFIYAPDVNKRFQDSNELFSTGEIDRALEIIKEYEIDYILLTKKIKEELWEEGDEGLQFLLLYSKSFKKIYNQNDIEIWRII
jgi:hypothetical protein